MITMHETPLTAEISMVRQRPFHVPLLEVASREEAET